MGIYTGKTFELNLCYHEIRSLSSLMFKLFDPARSWRTSEPDRNPDLRGTTKFKAVPLMEAFSILAVVKRKGPYPATTTKPEAEVPCNKTIIPNFRDVSTHIHPGLPATSRTL
jgi:hypothetical protein